MTATRVGYDEHKWGVALSMSEDGKISGTRVCGMRCSGGSCFEIGETAPITGKMVGKEIELTFLVQLDTDERRLKGFAKSVTCFQEVGVISCHMFGAADWRPGDPIPSAMGCG